jgi:hypothetical protein
MSVADEMIISFCGAPKHLVSRNIALTGGSLAVLYRLCRRHIYVDLFAAADQIRSLSELNQSAF